VRAQTRATASDRASARQRRAERVAQAKLNRAQLRAMEVRAAETLHPQPGPVPAPTAAEVAETSAAQSLARRTVAASRRVVARPVALTREQEYRFIRADLRRLGLIAGVLFVLMIALLFVVD
jgi:hypothetical protein